MNKPTICQFGDSAIILSWENEIRPEINRLVRNADSIIQERFNDQLVETVIAYQSLTIYLKLEVSTLKVLKIIEEINFSSVMRQTIESDLWEIPVCYSLNLGIDLNDLSVSLGLSIQEIIKLHSSTIYSVYFIGFLPGFLYLGGLLPQLHQPRKQTPRLSVSAGAVGIGGGQTGIYPMKSPGGWHIIGQTPVKLFDAVKNPPMYIKAGDKVQFVEIDEVQYNQLSLAVTTGDYVLTKTALK